MKDLGQIWLCYTNVGGRILRTQEPFTGHFLFLHVWHVQRTSHTLQWHAHFGMGCGLHSIITSLGQLIVKQITSPVNCSSIFLQEMWIGSAVMWNLLKTLLIQKSCSCTLFMGTECSCKFTADRKEGLSILDCFLHQTPHCRGNSFCLVNLSISFPTHTKKFLGSIKNVFKKPF